MTSCADISPRKISSASSRNRAGRFQRTGLGTKLHILNVDIAKDVISRRLPLDDDTPGRMHWPSQAVAGAVPVDSLFFERLTREKQRAAPGKPGKTFWSDPSDQEPWDCLVYAYAALQGLKLIPNGSWARMVAIPAEPRHDGAAPSPSAAVSAAPAVPAPKPRPKSAPRIAISPMMRR